MLQAEEIAPVCVRDQLWLDKNTHDTRLIIIDINHMNDQNLSE